ncbi:MAG: hypothetical protein QXW79_01105 [Thermoplasmata archaeon]
MEDIINVGTFIRYLTYYLKLGIYANKDKALFLLENTKNSTTVPTEDMKKGNILEKCIKLYNKYKLIENSDKISGEDETTIRKCLKRFNLVLKIDPDGKPIDIRDKKNQLRMVYLKEHPSISKDDLDSMMEHARNYKIDVLVGVPLIFILRDGNYKKLLWQYTRALFYITQLLISNVGKEEKDKNIKYKHEVFNDAAQKLEVILENITKIEEEIKIRQAMSLDDFLNKRLVKSGISEKNVKEASNEVKEIFNRKGLGNNQTMFKMIDSISNKLSSIDLSQGNIVQNMFSIAQNVAQEMRGDLEKDPEKFRDTLGTITEIFKDVMNQDNHMDKMSEKNCSHNEFSQNNDNVTDNFKKIFDVFFSISNEKNVCNNDVVRKLEDIIKSNGLNRDDFFKSVMSSNGEIDILKLEKYLRNINVKK